MRDHKKHEHTDTWRTLKGLDPIQSFWCRIGFHKWTNWEVYESAWAAGHVTHAQCYCARCGMPRITEPAKGNIK
jgi:hypothetical protein